MEKQSSGFKIFKSLITCLFVLSFSALFSQVDESKQTNEKRHDDILMSSDKQDAYTAEVKVLKNKTDSITYLYDSQNIAKLISIKNKSAGISNAQFHKYAQKYNPTFRFDSKLENENSIVYFNKEKTLLNIKIFADNSKQKLLEIVFVSGQKMIDKILTTVK